jgi:hypothetical protein
MKAVILVLLLVVATLVHSAPEEISKSLYTCILKGPVIFLMRYLKEASQVFVPDLVTHVQPRNLTYA